MKKNDKPGWKKIVKKLKKVHLFYRCKSNLWSLWRCWIKRGIETNKIEKFRTELEKYKEKYALLIKEHIQEEINKIDSDIEISIYSNDIDRIYVSYKEFKFEFTYYYSMLSRESSFRGYGKTNTHGYSYDRYTREEQKERERAYGYVRSILSVLEDS